VGRLIELADTSAWTNRVKDVATQTDFDGRVSAGEIATCEMVKLELLRSGRDYDDVVRRRDDLDALREISIGTRVWRRATDVLELLAKRGPLHHRHVPIPDLVIAAAGELAELPVCHYDAHFELIAEVTGQPMRAIAPLGSL
jgi:predicted nucleic acid-binding protein